MDVVVPIPIFPAPSIVKRVLVPSTEEELILNLPWSARSEPMVQVRGEPGRLAVVEPTKAS
jgi:hypothetical protein